MIFHIKTVIKLVIIFALSLLLIVLLVNMYVGYYSQHYIFQNSAEIPKTQVVLILGAGVFSDGRLTATLQDRVDTAILLYKDDHAKKILVAGDNSRVEYNEVNAVQKYLEKEGVSPEDIFLDHAGFNTYDSMYRAKEIFEVDSMIITTQEFHLARSVYIARKLGIDAYGLAADKRKYLLKNSVRELFATAKSFTDVLIGTKPRYLGEKIPITGDGQVTWY